MLPPGPPPGGSSAPGVLPVTWEVPTTIEAGQAPGGLVFIHYVDGEPDLVQALPGTVLATEARERSAAYAAEQSERWTLEGRDVMMTAYNGDTGALIMMFPVTLMARLRRALDRDPD